MDQKGGEEIPQSQPQPTQENTEQHQADPISSFSSNIANLALIIESIDNTYLLNRACLENLCNMFQIAQPGDFDDVNDMPSLATLIEQQYQKKKSDLEQIIYQLMRGYDELNQKVNLNQLEKIMRILKSKNKSIYIFKDEVSNFCQCLCKGHQEGQEQQNEEQEQAQQNEVQEEQQDQEIIQTDTIQQEEKNVSQEEEQQQDTQELVRMEVCINEEATDVENKLEQLIEKQQKDIDEFQQQLTQNQQEEQPQAQAETNQQLDEIQHTQQELEQNVEQLKNSIQRSREQIEKLTEQRDALLEKGRELAQKQLELKQQQQQIIEQLQQNEQIEQQEEENKSISYQDIFGIMTLNNLNLNQLQNYNDRTNSLIFKLSKNYTVEIKSDDADHARYLNNDSILKIIPPMILNKHIFPFLSALELFKIREVCGWFKEQVKLTWPIVFKREMFEQLLSRDLAKSMFTVLQLQTLKATLFYKVQRLIEAIIQAIEWENLEQSIEQQENLDIDIQRLLIGFLTLFDKQHEIQYPHQIDGTFELKVLAKNIKQQVLTYFNQQDITVSFARFRAINKNFLSAPEFSIEFINSQKENKTSIYLTLLIHLLYFYGLMRQTCLIDDFQLKKWKQEQEILGKRQSYNPNFLEGAYKKLLLKSYQDQDEGEDEHQLENLSTDINEAQQFLKALTNLVPSENPEPDIVIRRNKTVTKIYIDVNTKLDILVQTIESCRFQSPQSLTATQTDGTQTLGTQTDVTQTEDLQNEQQTQISKVEQVEQETIQVESMQQQVLNDHNQLNLEKQLEDTNVAENNQQVGEEKIVTQETQYEQQQEQKEDL